MIYGISLRFRWVKWSNGAKLPQNVLSIPNFPYR